MLRNRLTRLIAGASLAIIGMVAGAELLVRVMASPGVEAERNYRSAHCFDDWMLVLCPSIQAAFPRPDGRVWELSTNEFAERITPSTLPGLTAAAPSSQKKETWFIGDSISMGYLLDDRFSPPWVFEEMSGRPTRNLGSDSLGTIGIRTRLERAIERHPQTGIEHLIWIYNTSDFTDDPKEQRLRTSVAFRQAYRLHFMLSQRSALYISLRKGRPDSNVLPPGFEAAPPPDHPTWTALREFRDFVRQRNLPLTILVYPGFDPRTQGPAHEDPTTQALLHFLDREGFDYRDLSASFEEAFRDGRRVYIQGDGHPDEDMSLVFASHALEAIQSAAAGR